MNKIQIIIIYSFLFLAIISFIFFLSVPPKSKKTISTSSTQEIPTVKHKKTYHCSDFTTQASAQAFFNQNPKDIYHLDRDRDGKACENLP